MADRYQREHVKNRQSTTSRAPHGAPGGAREPLSSSYAGMGESERDEQKLDHGRDDESIREDVRASLADDDALDASEIDVRVADGDVTLDGSVGDRWSKRRADDLAGAVRGVKDVHNRLRVARRSS